MTIEEMHEIIKVSNIPFPMRVKLHVLLNALTPPTTLEECEAIVGAPMEGSTFRWQTYTDDEFRTNAVGGVKDRLEAAQRAVIAKRVADWIEGMKA